MADAEKTPDATPEDTSWVEFITKEKEEQKQHLIMMELRDMDKEDKPKTSRRFRKLLYFLLVACVVAIVVLAVKLSNANNNGEPVPGSSDVCAEAQEQVPNKPETNVPDKPKTKNDKNAEQEICLTHDCILAAAQIIESVDSTVDPCENFYDFACGGWMKARVVPKDSGSLASYGELRAELQLKLKVVLEEDIDVNETVTIQNVKKLYRSCLDEDLIEARNKSVIFPLLRELGGWPLLGDGPGGLWEDKEELDLARLLVAILKYNDKPLIYAWAGMDDKNNTQNILFIDEPRLGMPALKYFLDPSYEKNKLAYRKFIRNIGVMLGADVTTIDADVDTLVQLETDLSNITLTKEERRDANALYNKMTIKELKDNYTNIQPCWKYKFDWLEYLQGALRIPDEPVDITDEEHVVVTSIQYYTRLWNVLHNHSPRTIVNYAIWRIVQNRVHNLPRAFQDEYQEYKKTLYGTTSSRDRWRLCTSYVKSVNGEAVGRMFVERHFDERSKDEAMEMIENIRASFFERLDQLTWMDDDMKQEAREKGEKIVAAVAYQDAILNDTALEEAYPLVTMNEDKYFENVLAVLHEKSKYYFKFLRKINDEERPKWIASPATVNAFYNFQMNQISFPAGILQAPYFHAGRPKAMNYGGLGFLVGHEISHGFDDQGRQYDKDGNLNNWWTDDADAMFKTLAQCIVDQYERFFWEEAGLNVNGINTQGENIADNGGIKQAYSGYKRWRKSNGNYDLILPGLKYTHDQLFFIAFSQTRCGLDKKDYAVNRILTGVHSPNRFRVIGSLRNMPEFGEVFNCPVNSSMNPEEKCSVW